MECGGVFPVWIGVVIGLLVVFIVFCIAVIHRKWEVIKFILYMEFDILFFDNEKEDFTKYKYNILIISRYFQIKLIV